MVPQAPGSGGAWTFPTSDQATPTGRGGSAGQPQMPEALRGLMDRMGSALPNGGLSGMPGPVAGAVQVTVPEGARDRKSTRLNSSHANISYAVFCLKKKK